MAIAVLCTHTGHPQVRFSSRVGTRASKYADLSSKTSIDRELVTIEPAPPYFRWLPFEDSAWASVSAEYTAFRPLDEIFETYSSGIQTKRDALCVAFSKEEIWQRVTRLHELRVEVARREFGLGNDGRDWSVASAKADIAFSGPNRSLIQPLLYRPFDRRFTYWTGRTKGFLAYPRREVMQHVVRHKNVGLTFNRQVVGNSISHFGVSRIPICHGTFYLGNKGQDYFAPLVVFDDDLTADHGTARGNLSTRFWSDLQKRFGERRSAGLSLEEAFHYIYALVHSPAYRTRYAEFLKIDFPRIPLPGEFELLRELAPLGGELIALHLIESPKLDHLITTYTGPKNPEVVRVGWSNNTVWLDAGKTSAREGHIATIPGSIGFKGVPKEVWDFHIGGYRVCHKWLSDRKGRTLSNEDLAHYHKIVVARKETIPLMQEIDAVIERHGGWPGAFQTAKAPELVERTLKVAEPRAEYGSKRGANR